VGAAAALDRRWWGWWRCCRWTAGVGLGSPSVEGAESDATLPSCYLVWFDQSTSWRSREPFSQR
jgi:hypothetical protein